MDENETDDKKALGQRFKSLNSSVKRDSTDKRRVIPPGKVRDPLCRISVWRQITPES